MSDSMAEIGSVREQIENIDGELVALIARRVALARRLGECKRAAGLPTLDPAREAQIVRRAGELARAADLPDDDVRQIFWQVIGISRRAQAQP